MKGLGYIPHVSGWAVFGASYALIVGLMALLPGPNFLGQILTAIQFTLGPLSPMNPYTTGIGSQVGFFIAIGIVSAVVTVIVKVLDAPKPKLGSGKRFSVLEHKLARQKGVTNPAGLAASIGRKKYGPKRFARLSRHRRTR